MRVRIGGGSLNLVTARIAMTSARFSIYLAVSSIWALLTASRLLCFTLERLLYQEVAPPIGVDTIRALLLWPLVVLGFRLMHQAWRRFAWPGAALSALGTAIAFGLISQPAQMLAASLMPHSVAAQALLQAAPFDGREALPWIASALEYAVLYLTCVSAAAGLLCYHRFARERVLRARAEAAATLQRLRVLRTQINPHFLFNALNSIVSASELQSPHVQQLVMELSELLRRTLNASEVEEHELQQELAFVTSYLRIQQIRRPSRIHWRLHVEPDCAGAAVPSLVLLTLAENAIKHGLRGRARDVHIEISAQRRDRQLLLSIRNTCPAVAPAAPEGSGMGLGNIRERLLIHFGAAAALCARRTGPQFYEAVIGVPWRTIASTRRAEPHAPSIAVATSGAAIDRA